MRRHRGRRSNRARCGRFAPLHPSIHLRTWALSLSCLPFSSLTLQSGTEQCISEVLYCRRAIILDPNVASSVRATLTQKLQFDTDDHLEDDLPLRSRVLPLSTCFMRMERGPTTTIPRATLQGLIQLSGTHMSQLYSLSTTPRRDLNQSYRHRRSPRMANVSVHY